MTRISINKNKFEDDLSQNTTIEQILDRILNDKRNKESVITNICVDGINYSIEESSPILKKTIENFKSINLHLCTNIELAFETLNSCHSYIDIIIDKIRVLITHYQEDKLALANKIFAEIIEILDLYIQLFSKIYKTIRYKYSSHNEEIEIVQNLEISLLSILKAILLAKEKNDIIMLKDLLEYELIDNLIEWKIKAIPALKKLQTLKNDKEN